MKAAPSRLSGEPPPLRPCYRQEPIREGTVLAPPAIPRATYRLQFSKDFTFADATRLVPYLARLGISHLYASSFLKARAGSSHGYDIIDHNALNPEIGDEADLQALVDALAAEDMGMVLDFVPNHMGVGGADNAWWLDVLEWGRDSPYAGYFDIDWQTVWRGLQGKVLLPFLGDPYGAVLERGELVPRFDRAEGSFSIWYWGHRFPLAPADYAPLLAPLREMAAGNGLEEILLAARGLSGGRHGPRAVAARRRLASDIKTRLRALTALHDAIDETLARLAADIPALHALLERQHWRASFWRVASDEINYRRFFDINDLAGLRMENPELFALAHRKVFDMLAKGQIHGLRIDHIDGLHNPAQYCRRLQSGAAGALGRPGEEQPLWLVVEKILAPHERVRRDWPVAGTTGYDFCNQALGLFVDHRHEEEMDRLYAGFISRRLDFDSEVHAAKKQIIREVMASERNVLGAALARLAASHWRSRDFTAISLTLALAEVVACFPVYRTYVTAQRITDLDRRYIDWAVKRAGKTAPEIDDAVFDFIHGVLDLSAARGRPAPYKREAVVAFTMSLQQYTGPVMAKGMEDTAFYRYNRLIALNEVGGDPQRFGLSPGAFHQAMRSRRRDRPHAQLATATHDSKRGEDMRLRLAALSELPGVWRQCLERWSRINAPLKRPLDQGLAPDANDEIFLYQTLLGAWPMEGWPEADFTERLETALVKSLREAKRQTSWSHPDPAYEAAAVDFLKRLLETDRRNPFFDDFLPLQRRLGQLGMVYGLAQTLLKLTAPGVPDFYQGTELWQLALVDPDNRRPVDWQTRRGLLDGLDRRGLPELQPNQLLPNWTDGALKLALIRSLLAHRRRDPELYRRGDYRPLAPRGDRRDHLLAFSRGLEGRHLVVVVPRLLAGLWPEEQPLPPLGAAWGGLSVEAPKGAGPFRDLLTGQTVTPAARRGGAVLPVAELFARLPVAALVGAAPEDPPRA